jgi:copper chaperone CopZ
MLYTWMVEGDRTMHCGGCSSSVEFALSQIQGVESVQADFHTQQIEVRMSDFVDAGRIVKELDELGYVVKEQAHE